MSGSVHDAAPSPGGRPAGLLEKLMAAIRPGFRAGVLTFEAADPVFGGQACAVPRCHRVARCRQMCFGHPARWPREGTPDLAGFIATTPGDWNGRPQLGPCQVPACQSPSRSKVKCEPHPEEERARLIPRYVQRTVNALADVGAASFLQHDEEYWAAFGTPAGGQRLSGRRAFVLDSCLRIEALALGHGWDQEYPRDIWRLRTLGIDTDRVAALRFTGITQSWLKQLAKRVSRWRLTTGTGPGSR